MSSPITPAILAARLIGRPVTHRLESEDADVVLDQCVEPTHGQFELIRSKDNRLSDARAAATVPYHQFGDDQNVLACEVSQRSYPASSSSSHDQARITLGPEASFEPGWRPGHSRQGLCLVLRMPAAETCRTDRRLAGSAASDGRGRRDAVRILGAILGAKRPDTRR